LLTGAGRGVSGPGAESRLVVNATFAKIRWQAAAAAFARLQHLLRPDTVHLLSIGDLADAITAANDILAPAEARQAREAQELAGKLEAEIHAHLRTMVQRDAALRNAAQALQQSDAALRDMRDALDAADELAHAVAQLTGKDIGCRERGHDTWGQALSIVDEIADANNRPRPSKRTANSRFGKPGR
jgi:exopolysaccharide biosynthesis predicted pyruvyltransferase EpsI